MWFQKQVRILELVKSLAGLILLISVLYASGTKSVNSFSNYYARVSANSGAGRDSTFLQSVQPVSLPKNLVAEYVHKQSQQFTPITGKVRRDDSKEKPKPTPQYGYGWPTEVEKEVEKISPLDDLLEVLGPALFLIPFVLKALPFGIPAIPLSYILTRYEPGNITEIINRVTEFATQVTDLINQATG